MVEVIMGWHPFQDVLYLMLCPSRDRLHPHCAPVLETSYGMRMEI